MRQIRPVSYTHLDVYKRQAQLWDANKNASKYNEARMRITGETFNKMKSHKGEGLSLIHI